MRVAIDRRVYPASEGERFSADATLRVVDCPTCRLTQKLEAALETPVQGERDG